MANTKLKNAIIDIRDVEYLIDEVAARLIEKKEPHIALTRLFDDMPVIFPLSKILQSIEKGLVRSG